MEEEREKTEINKALSPQARDKLSEISARVRLTRESIDRSLKPTEKKQSHVLGMFIAIIAIPILMLLFVGVLMFWVWFMMNPLDIIGMYGISIALIGCYTVFLTPRH